MMVERQHLEIFIIRFFPRIDSDADVRAKFIRAITYTDLRLAEDDEGKGAKERKRAKKAAYALISDMG
ncbi:hypothetical protein ACLB2K_029816 [Fragaria x ananassa]